LGRLAVGGKSMQRFKSQILLFIALILFPALKVHASPKEKILYQFSGGADGGDPASSSLIMDASGDLYGTVYEGGTINNTCPRGCGVVFELIPSAKGKWQEKVLYAFLGSPDGAGPGGNLVFDASGNIYGTTFTGGATTNCNIGCGVVFRLSPRGDGGWTETVLYRFQDRSDGAGPNALIFDAAGDLYGTTTTTVFELLPPTSEGLAWTEKTLYASPYILASGVIFDNTGNLYGSVDDGFEGSTFELKYANGQWTSVDLYKFKGYGNGGSPTAVVLDKAGNLYGVGTSGGNNNGIAFELQRSGNDWNETMLYNFCSLNYCADGADPEAGVVIDGNGVLYGNTSSGGACTYCGVVFKLERTEKGWKETVLHAFRGGSSDGRVPSAPLLLDQLGNLYGTAFSGTDSGDGVVYEVIP
jgi:hypothetical protein